MGWLLAAGWAAAFPLVSDVGTHRVWGVCAAAGYTAAAVAARVLPRPRAVRVPVVLALAGAVVLPLLLLVLTGQAQSEVDVIERSGRAAVRDGDPVSGRAPAGRGVHAVSAGDGAPGNAARTAR